MLAKGKGAFVNLTSEAGLRGSAGGTAYTVSKSGLVGLTRSVAVQYRDAGIRCNANAPGLTSLQVGVQRDLSVARFVARLNSPLWQPIQSLLPPRLDG
jgi:NAD(P)-dependent dehydrogenase (short-subunit alcohol dehydrogenase family)